MIEYEIIYDYDSEYCIDSNCAEIFEGSFSELKEYIKIMMRNGCYNISATAIIDD